MHYLHSRLRGPVIGMIAFFGALVSAHAADKAARPILIGLDADMSALSALGGEAIRRGAIIAIDEVNQAAVRPRRRHDFFLYC